MEVFNRIISSKKFILTIIGAALAIFGDTAMRWEPIVTEAVTALFGVLVVVQGALDYKHGSPSDGTSTQ